MNNIGDYDVPANEIVNYQNVWVVIILVAVVGLIGLGIGIVKRWRKSYQRDE